MVENPTDILELHPVAQAFNLISEDFDRDLENDITKRIRENIYEMIEGLVLPGSSIVDINCGTGIDAIALARRGFRVTGIDISPKMIEHAKRKAEQDHLQNVSFLHGSFERLSEVFDQPADLVLSNFAGLNCSVDLSVVAREVGCIISPGGFLLAVVMPRFSFWESLSYFLRGQWRGSIRRFRKQTTATGFRGKTFIVHYHSPTSFERAFQPWFDVRQLIGVSIFSPSPQSMSFYRSYPRLVRWLERLDDLVAPLPLFRSIGDHYIMVLQRRAS
jgi:ubiquinone/menaquinone biosynthesis C-methylase UbiE